ncbi:hypothetical protein TGFOU_209640 [Toxoplasma gondii FOU]|uniref:Uncharacterized protein n=1 Tax=Toxoplasma gondii FOU TaxID=943167 RepID=A0A086KZB5_TOXGO|nr:hypothetical protein TGFOU_209640 [Toxoplasma gondii FOU]
MTREKSGGDCFSPFQSFSSPASGPPVFSRKGTSPANCVVEKTRKPFSSLSPLYADSSYSSTSPLCTSPPEATSSSTSAPVSSLSSASIVCSFSPRSSLSSSSHGPASPHPSSSSSSSSSSRFCVFSDTLRRLKEISESAAAVGQSAASLVERLYALALERDALEEAEEHPVESPKSKNETVEEETEAHAPKEEDVPLSSAEHLVVSRLEPMLLSLQSVLNREKELACRGQEVVEELEAALRLHLQSDASFLDTCRTEKKQRTQGEDHAHETPRDIGSPPSPLTRHASSSFSLASYSSSASPASSASSAASESVSASPVPVFDAQEGAKVESEKARVQSDRARREKEAICSFLVLCHRLAASLEEAVQFRQSVKEELRHFASAETFRAAKIAFAAEPFVSEQRDILLKARDCLDAWTLFRARREDAPTEARGA